MTLIHDRKEGPEIWRFEHLIPYEVLCHGVFTRHGGVSQGAFASLNTSFGCGDHPGNVAKNRARIARRAGLAETVYLNQVHGDEVLVMKSDAPPAEQGPITADAVVTDVCNRLLVVQVADCQAVLLFDPVRRVIANVHSGWRGSVRNVLGKTVAVMARCFGCRPADLRAAIAPSLGPCCAEFVYYRRELPRELWLYKDHRDRFDFWAISRDQLLNEGLRPDFVVHSGLCTRCHTDQFYSYRASRRTGRFAVVIGLRE